MDTGARNHYSFDKCKKEWSNSQVHDTYNALPSELRCIVLQFATCAPAREITKHTLNKSHMTLYTS
jgi:hypothetical protein